jgi:N4-gp56 family major capsid protein
MAQTIFETTNPLAKKVWEEKLFRETIPETYWNRFFGKTPESVVQEKTDLEGEQGDTITFGLINRLVSDGVQGDTILKGKEEAMSTYDDKVVLDQYRNGVVSKGRMSRKRVMFKMTEEAKVGLKQWMKEKVDKLCFNAITTTPSFTVYRDGATGNLSKTSTFATAKAALTAANSKLNLATFGYLRTIARTGNDRQFIPIRPITIKGRDWYVLLCHEDVLFDIKQDTNFLQAQRECQERSDEHPLFVGATAIYDQVIVHAHEFMPKASDGGGGAVDWAQCVLMGAQALCWGWGMRPDIVQDDDDYENQLGWAINIIAGVKKPVFNSTDYGSFGVALARTKVSG